MSHRLEQFVSDHREEFDSEEPGKKLWDKIRLEMDPPKEKKSIVVRLTRTSLSVAAAVLLVIAAGIWYLSSHRTPGSQTPEVVQAPPAGKQPSASGTNPSVDTPQSMQEKEQLAKTTESKDDKGGDKNAAPATQESIVKEEMVHYARLVELKHKELKVIEKDEPLLYRQFASDVNKLDSVYHGLQQQLPKNPNKEQLLEAMLQNLQLQMGLLNHQLDIIKQINHSKKTAYEKAYKTA
ncbi:hypothetical protein Q4E93_04770 [Flavitalea sp. BT771]|uniref:hypothetical protein n=1 Tax=Flavitalea sp. BT771 TaxID=3063329 RepID=UPI0026E1F3E4|nr:hypothetical protein [Flavitalea sp. BT771]MDO6429882.1 hypothetical protein [Flavitalea sp. BT771]MDV6217990.1 hypothetical protein [Flavitalea sp. BT771]